MRVEVEAPRCEASRVGRRTVNPSFVPTAVVAFLWSHMAEERAARGRRAGGN